MGFGVTHELPHKTYVSLDKFCDFFKPQFPHLYNGNDNSATFLKLLALNEMMWVKYLAQGLAHGELSVREVVTAGVVLHPDSDKPTLAHLQRLPTQSLSPAPQGVHGWR